MTCSYRKYGQAPVLRSRGNEDAAGARGAPNPSRRGATLARARLRVDSDAAYAAASAAANSTVAEMAMVSKDLH